MTPDAELLRRYAETRSERAFSDFVGRHLNLVYFTAVRVTAGDTTLAQDITQAVFTVAARQSYALARHATVTGWLHTTTRNIAARVMRNERTRQRYERAAAQDRAMTGDSDNDWERLRPVIDDALQGLSARDRDAILERFFEARSFVEIGESWRISADAARMRVDRALEKLRAALQRRGIQSMTSALALVLTAQGGVAAPIGLATSVSSAAVAASAAPTAAVAWLTIMSSAKTIVAAATGLVVLAIGTAVFEYEHAKSIQCRLDLAHSEIADLRRAASEKRASAIDGSTAPPLDGTAGSATQPTSTDRQNAAQKSASAAPHATSVFEMLIANQDYANAWVAFMRTNIRADHLAFYRQAGLTRDQIARFEMAMARRLQSKVDIASVARSEGTTLSDPAVSKLQQQADAGAEGELKEILGEAAYVKLQEYRNTAGAVGYLKTLEAPLNDAGIPLSASQRAVLLNGAGANGTGGTPAREQWKKAIESARASLSAEQFDALQLAQEQLDTAAEVNRLATQLLGESR